MIMYKGGSVVQNGCYWNPFDGQRVTVRQDGTLPGDESKSYLKISPAGLLIIAPLFGMMYVMFLPLFGIGVFFVSWIVPLMGTLAGVAITAIRVCGRIAGRSSVFFNWNSSRAYFTSVRKKEKAVFAYTRVERHALYAYLS